jgi:FkbM family methyltransferase
MARQAMTGGDRFAQPGVPAALVVVDGGARGGLGVLDRLHPRIDLHAFEPDAVACRALEALAGYRRVSAIPFALAGVAGRRTLHATRHPSLSSLLAPDLAAYERHFGRMAGYPGWVRAIEVVATPEIEAITLDAWAERAGVVRIDVLKLDTQGTELDILAGARDVIARGAIGVIRTEVAFLPVYRGQALFPAIDRHLVAAGFSLVDCRFYPDRVGGYGWRGRRYVEPPRWAAGGDATYALAPDRWPAAERTPRAVTTALVLSQLGYGRSAARWLRAAGLDEARLDAWLTAWTAESAAVRWAARWVPPALWRR